MKDFFANLHWRMPVKSTPGNRWSSWARSLSAGRRRIYSRYRLAVMELLRPAMSAQRWELKAWSLFPRLNLVVRPILQHLSANRSLALRSNSARRPSSGFEFRNNSPMVMKRRSIGAGEAEDFSVPTGKARSSLNPVLPSNSRKPPLDRVFRRLQTTGIQTEHLELITKESIKIARRVAEETRRVEHYGPTSMVTKQDLTARKILESARGTETKLLEQLSELNKTAPSIMHGSAPFAAPANGLTIEQLTEQVMRRIDDQIVAHKERMGKVF